MVNPTRIAGPAFDAHDAARIRQTARILAVTDRIRSIAHAADRDDVEVPVPRTRRVTPHGSPLLGPY